LHQGWSYFYGQSSEVAKIDDGTSFEEVGDVDHLFPSGTHVQTLYEREPGVLRGSNGYLLVTPIKVEFESTCQCVVRVRFKFSFVAVQGWTADR
jgi:hypothetical protein